MNRDIGIYLVTDAALCGRRGVVETVRQAVAGGVRVVQVRDKTAAAGDLLALVLAVAAAVGREATVLVNDRVDVYLAARGRGAAVHGVHIGQTDLPPTDTRAIIGAEAILGLTANTPAHLHALAAWADGCIDYLGVGVVHATATKPDHPQVLGIDGFARLARSTGVPSVAIGGVSVADVAALRAAGAAGAAVVSAICAAADARESARQLSAEWKRAAP